MQRRLCKDDCGEGFERMVAGRLCKNGCGEAVYSKDGCGESCVRMVVGMAM